VAHTRPAGHGALQPPQLIGSSSVFTQLVPQRVPPLVHAHCPETHVSSSAHAVVQLPQWATSVAVFAHERSHSVSVGAQLAAHVDPEQT
jgi:hypothetical protein